MPALPTRRHALIGLAATLLAALAQVATSATAATPKPADAAAWTPSRTVTLVVPYSPGGGVDAMARHVARELQAKWGQTVLVENVPGAGGLLGTRRVLDAPPDGHTLLVQIPSLLVIRHTPMYKGVDPAARLMPIATYAITAGVYAAHAGIPGKTYADLKRHCNAAPKPCSFGTTENVARVRLKMLEADIPNMIVVNYKGGGQLVNDLLGGNVDVGVMGYTAIAPHVKAGTVKIMMTSGTTRSPIMPDAQTAVEAGLPQIASETWYGLFAPLGTSSAVVRSVAEAVREVASTEATKTFFAALGSSVLITSPEAFAQLVREEDQRLNTLLKKYPLD